jgi:hypothetical protein
MDLGEKTIKTKGRKPLLDAFQLVGISRQTTDAYVRFEVLTAVTRKNAVFWDVTPRGCCKNRRFGGT